MLVVGEGIHFLVCDVRLKAETDTGWFPHFLSTSYFETKSFTEPGNHRLGLASWPDNSRAPWLSDFLALGLRTYIAITNCYMGPRIKQSPYAYPASTLPMESFPSLPTPIPWL